MFTKKNKENLNLKKIKSQLKRISVSLPDTLLDQLDEMVEQRNLDSRSQAITEMIHQQVTRYQSDRGHQIMAGTINLVFDHSIPNLQKQLAETQQNYLDEVISTLNVNLTHSQTLSVILVQGPGNKLQNICNHMTALRGVISGQLLMNSAILPPVHPLPPLSYGGNIDEV